MPYWPSIVAVEEPLTARSGAEQCCRNAAGMAPRGLKKVLKDSAPCRLVGAGFKRRFQTVAGTRLRGLTKRLEAAVWSEGEFPVAAVRSDAPAGGHWRGPGGGRRRGSAVDSQVSRLSSCTPAKRASSRMLSLTRLVFAALDQRGLEPVMGQRGVCSEAVRVGTAVDIVCFDRAKSNLVLVELKCGCSGWRTAAALSGGKACLMRGALKRAPDTTLNRHLAQLAATHGMFMREAKTLAKLGNLGILGIDGLLLYANDRGVDCYQLDKWWTNSATKIVKSVV